MNGRTAPVVLVVVLGTFVLGLCWLFRLRLGGGDVFPPYSSLRADPLGTRAFYEALAEQPEVQVSRWLKPLSDLPTDTPRTLILSGMTRDVFAALPERDALALDAAALAGARVVIVFRAELEPDLPENPSKAELAEKEKQEKVRAKRLATLPARSKPADWKGHWELELRRRLFPQRDVGAKRVAEVDSALPLAVPWKSDLYFALEDSGPWSTVYERARSPVVIERRRGRGAVVMASDAFFLSNEAMNAQRFPGLLAWLVGPNRSVIFVESHLGVMEDIGVAAVARRYGLTGAFFVLLLATTLWVWKRLALFVPPVPPSAQLVLSYHQTAGLEALLRRAVSPKQLFETCIEEWKTSSRAGDAERVAAALRDRPDNATSADSYNTVVRALKRRR